VSKYGAQAVVVDGHRFASKRESAHYCLLRVRVAAGEITELVLQPRFPLVVEGVKVGEYRGDFSYVERGVFVLVDVKGVRTPVYRLKKKLVKALYGLDIQEV
jgi:hypothetical protein